MNHWTHAREHGGRSFMTVPAAAVAARRRADPAAVVPLDGDTLRDGELEEVFADGGAQVRSTVWRP